jgi:hypothetical protein
MAFSKSNPPLAKPLKKNILSKGPMKMKKSSMGKSPMPKRKAL